MPRLPIYLFSLLSILSLVFLNSCALLENVVPVIAIIPSDTFTPTPSATPSQTSTNTASPSPSPTATDTPTPSITPTLTPTETPTLTFTPTETETPIPSPTPAPVILIGAGDIAYCGDQYQGDEQTASILERYPNAAIFTAGDNVQGVGSRAEYNNCFEPSWGRFKDRIRPAPGNHDYMTESGAPYYEYFNLVAGSPGQGYYSYDLGDWHIVALNSNCDAIACGFDSQQAAWLREDLATYPSRCTLLYWHYPRYSSGIAGNYGILSPFWRIALEFGAEVVVSGHDHNYERFAPQDGDSNYDPNGIRQFVVGTGGFGHLDFNVIKPNSEVRDNTTSGVIKFSLYPGWYEWEFIPVDGGTFTDYGSDVCH